MDVDPESDGCPQRVGMVWLNVDTGEARPARCGRNVCDYCLPRNAWRRAAAVACTVPERTGTLTLVADAGHPDPWSQARRRVNRTREWLKRWEIDPGKWAWFIEPNPEGTGYHCHFAQWGSYLPFEALQRAATWAGCGRWTRIERVRDPVDLSSYGLKTFGLAHYGVKTFDRTREDVERREALRVNGGRLGHYSRHYWRTPDGSVIGGSRPTRSAERLAVRLALGDDNRPESWTLATLEAGETWPRVMRQHLDRGMAGKFTWDGKVDQVARWRLATNGDI